MTAPTRIVTDRNGRIVEASVDAAELFAVDGEAVLGQPLAAFVAPERRGEFHDLLRDLAGGAPLGVALQLAPRKGAQVAVDVEAVAEPDGERLEWLIASGSGRAAASRLDAPHLDRLLSRLPIGIVSVNSALSVEYVSPAAVVYLGRAEVGAMLPEAWGTFALRNFAKRLFGDTPPGRQLIDTEGGRRIELDGIPANQADTALLLLQDVTVLERGRRAEREFVTNAAHELRTPIAAITNAVEVLQAGAKERPEDLDLFLEHVSVESDRLARLVAALLLLARIQTGQETPNLAVIQAGPLLRDVAGRLEPADGVALRVEASDAAMLADYDLLTQAVWNLAANATAHTTSGEVHLRCLDFGYGCMIEIADTGIGISENDLEHVFDRFYRIEPTGSGFGLGLPLAREIAAALGGTLTLDSEPGVGTRARIFVPSARVVHG